MVSAAPMDKSVDTIPMIFEAKSDAASGAKFCTINVKPTEPPKELVVSSAVGNEIDIAEIGNQRSYYSVTEQRLAIAVTEEIPITINLTQPKLPILRNGSMNLKVTAERRNDYKGAIASTFSIARPELAIRTVQIPEGQNEGTITISANGNAPLQKWNICVVGSADFGKGAVWMIIQQIPP